MTTDQHNCRAMILLLQAEMDGELAPIADEVGVWRRQACPECQAAFDVVRIAQAMSWRLTHHALPAKARRKLIHNLRAPRE